MCVASAVIVGFTIVAILTRRAADVTRAVKDVITLFFDSFFTLRAVVVAHF